MSCGRQSKILSVRKVFMLFLCYIYCVSVLAAKCAILPMGFAVPPI